MNIETLRDKQAQVEARFDTVQKSMEAKRHEADELEDELKRLQGEWRFINNAIKELEPVTGEPDSDPALTIKAKERFRRKDNDNGRS